MKEFSDFSPEEIRKILPKLSRSDLIKLEAALERKKQDDIVERISLRIVRKSGGLDDAGPMYFLRNFTKTENYHADKQGLQPKMPFPYKPQIAGEWDYLDWLMHYMLDSYKNDYDLYVPKTREMATSWEAVGYAFWSCEFFPNVQVLAQSEKDEKAKGLVKYANILYENQPAWMKERFPLKRGRDEGTTQKIEWANGSSFIGVPQGERQAASYHPTIYISDEAAHQPAWKSTINIVKPVARQVICISSAAFSDFGIAVDPSLAVESVV